MRKIITTAVTIATVVVTAASASASASTSLKTEHFSLISVATNASHIYSAIATGNFTAGGTAVVTDGATAITLHFPRGTITLAAKHGHAKTVTNAACLLHEAAPGTFTIVRGTGAYAGISGSGTTTSTATFVGAIVAGKCSNSTPATAIQIIDSGTGLVSLG